jgi:hypothetical protein
MHPRPIETVNTGATASAGSRRPARPSRKPASCAPQPPGPRPLQRPASPTATESSCSLLRPGTPMDPRAALPLAKRGSWQARNIGAATIRLCRPPHQCPASLFQVQLSRPLGPVSGRRFTTPTASAEAEHHRGLFPAGPQAHSALRARERTRVPVPGSTARRDHRG